MRKNVEKRYNVVIKVFEIFLNCYYSTKNELAKGYERKIFRSGESYIVLSQKFIWRK